jgi:hypothetical protein
MHGGPHNSTGAPNSNHQTSKLSRFGSRSQIFFGCFQFEALKVELDPQRMGDLIIPLGPSNHQTSKFSRFGSKRQIVLWVF